MDERDRKHPEAAAGRLDGAYDRLPMGVVRCLAGETLRILAVNRVFLEMLGEAETLPVCDEDAASLREAFEHCEENGTFYREVRMTERFGERIWVRCDGTVSYTHLDVYKSQDEGTDKREGRCGR